MIDSGVSAAADSIVFRETIGERLNEAFGGLVLAVGSVMFTGILWECGATTIRDLWGKAAVPYQHLIFSPLYLIFSLLFIFCCFWLYCVITIQTKVTVNLHTRQIGCTRRPMLPFWRPDLRDSFHFDEVRLVSLAYDFDSPFYWPVLILKDGSNRGLSEISRWRESSARRIGQELANVIGVPYSDDPLPG